MLGALQKKLESNFYQLSQIRAQGDLPIFALEHGFNDAELAHLTELLHAQLKVGSLNDSYWLVWVIYAAELGYNYDGHEYWESFSKRTPNWEIHGDREKVREWFKKFHNLYGGVLPTGRWAEKFSIISWPITHALLPKDLQAQLARSLYQLRYELSSLARLDSKSIGELISRSSHSPTSRYKNFLDQPDLVGKIVLSILDSERKTRSAFLDSATLSRLIEDIKALENAFDWIDETRKIFKKRLDGVSSGRLGTIPSQAARINLTVLKQNSEWHVFVEISGLAAIAQVYPEVKGFLQSTRCQLKGSRDKWLPGTWLLSSLPKKLVVEWPDDPFTFVEFEEETSLKFKAPVCLTAGVYLFRINQSGIGSSVSSGIIETNTEYLILTNKLTPNLSFTGQCDIRCEGVQAYFFKVPENPSTDYIQECLAFGLRVRNGIEVSPMGVFSSKDEQCIEIVEGRSCDLAIHAEWPTDNYLVSIDNSTEVSLPVDTNNSPVFCRLASMVAGEHLLKVKVSKEHNLFDEDIERSIILKVRPLQVWEPSLSSSSGIYINTEPYAASLDDFWEGHYQVSVKGPEDHEINCFLDVAGSREAIGAFTLPVTYGEWNVKLRQFLERLSRDEEKSWILYNQASLKLIISAGELGYYSTNIDREIKPIRWLFKQSLNKSFLVLIDDIGLRGKEEVYKANFATPTKLEKISLNSNSPQIQMSSPGGLFSASYEELQDAILVNLPDTNSLRGLLTEPNVSLMTKETIDRDLKLLNTWANARTVGVFATRQRDRIVKEMTLKIFSTLCGKAWGDLEKKHLSLLSYTPLSFNLLEKGVGGTPAFAFYLKGSFGEFSSDQLVTWFLKKASEYEICKSYNDCMLILKLAMAPHHVATERYISEMLKAIISNQNQQVLLRGARFVALQQASNGEGLFEKAIPKWSW